MTQHVPAVLTQRSAAPGKIRDPDTAIAEQRFREFRERMDAVPRQPSRAIGPDAPPRHR